jgi:hypothetical protein
LELSILRIVGRQFGVLKQMASVKYKLSLFMRTPSANLMNNQLVYAPQSLKTNWTFDIILFE